MRLAKDQRKTLLDVLAAVFTARDDFSTFLKDSLGKNLDEIATGDLRVARSKVVDEAERAGWLRDLIDALHEVGGPEVRARLERIELVGEAGVGPSGPTRAWQLRYFEQVEDALGNVRPAIAPRFDPDSATLARQQWPLADVFVPLELMSSRGRIEGELDWNKLVRSDRVVLTGGPGSGKSTLLRHLVLSAIERRRKLLAPAQKPGAADADAGSGVLSRIPVWIDLPRAVLDIQQARGPASPARWYRNLTTDVWLQAVASATFLLAAEDARALLETGELLLVFDGLDEIADPEARLALAEVISKLPRAFGGLEMRNPVVVACREKAWERGAAFAPFEQIRILPMDRAQWERYFDRWCRAVWENDAEAVLQRLRSALRDSREVEKMAANPQTATMLAILAREGDLPHERVRLYDEYLNFALMNDRLNTWGGAGDVRGHLVALAVEAQDATGPDGEHLDGISERRARLVLGARVRAAAQAASDDEVAKAGAPLLRDLELHTGLVSVRRSEDPGAGGSIVAFTHRTMQEFLVACHYAGHPDDVLRHVRDRFWLVSIALTAAILAKDEAFDALNRLLGYLAREPAAAATRHEDLVEWGERLAVLSECLEELSGWKVPQKTLDPARAAHERIGRVLDELAPAERVAIAEGMGILGDPRLAPGTASRWVEIPAGASLVGSESSEAWIQERPARTVQLSTFRIQRWPVLVSEYERFIEARAYSDDRWWDEPGRSWRDATRVEAPEGWERIRPFGNRPVTGISWWEARAYARWLGSIELLPAGWFVTLPLEAQWERAARGPSGSPVHTVGRFPWGAQWSGARPRANCAGVLKGPCAVGLFSEGHSVEGVWDLAGNVGERCLDGFGPPETTPDASPALDPCHFDHKFGHTVRGGDWAAPVLNARIPARFPASRSDRSERIGFRCVAWCAPENLR